MSLTSVQSIVTEARQSIGGRGGFDLTAEGDRRGGIDRFSEVSRQASEVHSPKAAVRELANANRELQAKIQVLESQIAQLGRGETL